MNKVLVLFGIVISNVFLGILNDEPIGRVIGSIINQSVVVFLIHVLDMFDIWWEGKK